MGYAYFIHNVRDDVLLRSRYGKGTYVVITGATNPLGREFTNLFVRNGFNLILIDSNETKLTELRDSIKSNDI